MSKEREDVSFSTSGLLKWEMATFFSRLIPPFCDKCRKLMRKTIDHVPGLLILIENFLKYSKKLTINVSLSLFGNKNVRTVDNSRRLFLSGGSS